MVTIHSKDVTEILALYRMTKFDFPPHFWKALMYSFPTMYNTMGVKSGRFDREKLFSPKNALKTAI